MDGLVAVEILAELDTSSLIDELELLWRRRPLVALSEYGVLGCAKLVTLLALSPRHQAPPADGQHSITSQVLLATLLTARIKPKSASLFLISKSLAKFAALSHRLSSQSASFLAHQVQRHRNRLPHSSSVGTATSNGDNDDLELPSPCRHRRELHCLHLSPNPARHPVSRGERRRRPCRRQCEWPPYRRLQNRCFSPRGPPLLGWISRVSLTRSWHLANQALRETAWHLCHLQFFPSPQLRLQ